MDKKTLLTKTLLEKLEVSTDPKSIKDWYLLWWVNPRPHDFKSMRLTDRGCEDFENKLHLKSYQIDFPTPLETITNKFILDLEHYIDGPYYISRKYIKVFTEKMAVQLILFGGDLDRYSTAKEMSQKNNKNKS
jgi:hypothetical protein